MAKVLPHFGDVSDPGLGGFVAVDPEAVFLVEAAIRSARGECEGVAGAEG